MLALPQGRSRVEPRTQKPQPTETLLSTQKWWLWTVKAGGARIGRPKDT